MARNDRRRHLVPAVSVVIRAKGPDPKQPAQSAPDPAPVLAVRQRRKAVRRPETEPRAPITAAIASLRVPVRLRDGTQDVVNLTDAEAHGCRPLGEALAKAIGHFCGLGDSIKTIGTLKHYKKALRDILCFNGSLPATRRATTPEKITADWILDFQNSMIVPGQCTTTFNQKWRRVRMLLRQIQENTKALDQDAEAYLHDGNIELPSTAGLIEAGHVEPYSYEEITAIEHYFEEQVRATIARLKYGREMIAAGQDPREHGWKSRENQLWYLANILNFQPVSTDEWLRISGLAHRLRMREIHGNVFPTRDDIAAIYFLVLARTGINPDSLMKLKISNIFDNQNGLLRLNLEKLRAFGNEEREVVVRTESWRSAGGLLRICLKITEHMRLWLDDDDPDRDAVFIYYTAPNYSSNLKHIISLKESVRVCVIQEINKRNVMRNVNGTPITFVARRLRPTHKTKSYLGKQSLEAAGHDHRNLDTTVPYVANAVTLPIHEKTLAQAQRKLVQSFAGTIVSEGSDDPEAMAKAVGCDVEAAKGITKGSADVFLTSCKDFYNRPGGRPNTPCDKAWSCFECTNAVVTSRTLPRVLRFLDHMIGERKLLSEHDWNEKFGLPYSVVIDDILPSFSDDVVEAARLASADASFYLPIHLRQK